MWIAIKYRFNTLHPRFISQSCIKKTSHSPRNSMTSFLTRITNTATGQVILHRELHWREMFETLADICSTLETFSQWLKSRSPACISLQNTHFLRAIWTASNKLNLNYFIHMLFTIFLTWKFVNFITTQNMGILQHHDAVAGTEKLRVANDYTFRL